MVLGYSRLIWARSPSTRICKPSCAATSPPSRRSAVAAHDPLRSHEDRRHRRGRRRARRLQPRLIDLARRYGFQPRACRPYRAKRKGKVERPFRYIREDFFLGGVSRNLDDLNEQLRHWLDTVANPRLHATTNRVVKEAFAEERASLNALPVAPYRALLRLERRASHEGTVSVGGNL